MGRGISQVPMRQAARLSVIASGAPICSPGRPRCLVSRCRMCCPGRILRANRLSPVSAAQRVPLPPLIDDWSDLPVRGTVCSTRSQASGSAVRRGEAKCRQLYNG